MKKLVITGVTSFIGFHLAQKLSKFYQVVATTSADINTYSGIQKKRLDLLKNQNIKFDLLDVTKNDQIISIIDKHRPNYWINHAGFTKKYASLDYDEKLADTIHSAPLETIFLKLKEVGCLGFIGTGTCMEYSDQNTPHQENEPCAPSTPYGKSKLKQTQKSLELGKKYQIPTQIIRVFIPYGEYDDPKKLFPELVQRLWEGQEMPLSTGEQERNFIPIDELIHLYYLLLKENTGYEIYNGAGIVNMSVKNFILKTTAEQRLNQNLLKFGVYPLRPGETLFCTSSFDKLQNFYTKKTNNHFFFIESLEDFNQANNDIGFYLCSSPSLKEKLEQNGHYVFETLPFFSAFDHFKLSAEVNTDINVAQTKLSKNFDPEFTFNTIFYLQFSIAKDKFEKYLKQKFTTSFPFLKNNIKNTANPSPIQLSSAYIANLLNYLFLSLCPTLKNCVFLTAHHPLMLLHVKNNHPQKKAGLLVSSDQRKSRFKRTVFNFLNLFPSFIKHPIFNHYLKFPYDFIFDCSLLVNTNKQKSLFDLIDVNLEYSLKERVTAHFLSSQEMGKIFLKNPPHAFYHLSNVDLAIYFAKFAKENNIPTTLISHGSHAINECHNIEEDLIRHAKGLTLCQYSKVLAQSPLAGLFLEKYLGQNYIKSNPILWGKKIPKTISLREKYNIPQNKKIILHASTPKVLNSRRFVIYETPEEYLHNIFKIAENTSDLKDVVLIVKFRPNFDITEKVLKEKLAPFKEIIIDGETPFLQCLHEANLLISYSSTTMEEALQYEVPVLQYSHIYGFSFLPSKENSAIDLANEFNLQYKITEALSHKKDFSSFIYTL